MAQTSASKAVWREAGRQLPWARAVPEPSLLLVAIQSRPMEFRLSMHDRYSGGLFLPVGVSPSLPERVGGGDPLDFLSLRIRQYSGRPGNHLGIRCLLESSLGWGWRSARLEAPSEAARVESSSRSLLRSRAGRVGGVSAARMASSPFAAPATACPIARRQILCCALAIMITGGCRAAGALSVIGPGTQPTRRFLAGRFPAGWL